VNDIHDMKPLDETTVPAARPAMYALEANQGWFAKRGIVPGTRVTFSSKLEALIEKHRREK